MTKKKKSPKQQPTEDIQMASNSDIMVITGTKMKYLSPKENEYGSNHFFDVLDITPLHDLIELRKSLKCLFGIILISSIWKSMVQKLELPGGIEFKKMCLILWIYFFRNTTLRRKVSKLQVIVFLELIKFIKR